MVEKATNGSQFSKKIKMLFNLLNMFRCDSRPYQVRKGCKKQFEFIATYGSMHH